jgi:hypothetical protein
VGGVGDSPRAGLVPPTLKTLAEGGQLTADTVSPAHVFIVYGEGYRRGSSQQPAANSQTANNQHPTANSQPFPFYQNAKQMIPHTGVTRDAVLLYCNIAYI